MKIQIDIWVPNRFPLESRGVIPSISNISSVAVPVVLHSNEMWLLVIQKPNGAFLMISADHHELLSDINFPVRKSESGDWFVRGPTSRLKALASVRCIVKRKHPRRGLALCSACVFLIQLKECWIQFESKFGVKIPLSRASSVTTLPSSSLFLLFLSPHILEGFVCFSCCRLTLITSQKFIALNPLGSRTESIEPQGTTACKYMSIFLFLPSTGPALSSGIVCTLMFFLGNAFFLFPQVLGAWCSTFLICCCSGNRSAGSHGS